MSNWKVSCELCGRQGVALTRHHLIPRTRHSNQRARRDFSREERQQVAMICRACHNQVHALFTEKELEREFNTLGALVAHPGVSRFVEWIRTKPAGLRPSSKNCR